MMLTTATSDELDAFLALTLRQRGERLAQMNASERIRYAVAYARREGADPYRILDRFHSWEIASCDALMEREAAR